MEWSRSEFNLLVPIVLLSAISKLQKVNVAIKLGRRMEISHSRKWEITLINYRNFSLPNVGAPKLLIDSLRVLFFKQIHVKRMPPRPLKQLRVADLPMHAQTCAVFRVLIVGTSKKLRLFACSVWKLPIYVVRRFIFSSNSGISTNMNEHFTVRTCIPSYCFVYRET